MILLDGSAKKGRFSERKTLEEKEKVRISMSKQKETKQEKKGKNKMRQKKTKRSARLLDPKLQPSEEDLKMAAAPHMEEKKHYHKSRSISIVQELLRRRQRQTRVLNT